MWSWCGVHAASPRGHFDFRPNVLGIKLRDCGVGLTSKTRARHLASFLLDLQQEYIVHLRLNEFNEVPNSAQRELDCVVVVWGSRGGPPPTFHFPVECPGNQTVRLGCGADLQDQINRPSTSNDSFIYVSTNLMRCPIRLEES